MTSGRTLAGIQDVAGMAAVSTTNNTANGALAGVMTITVAVYTRVRLVGQIGAVWAGSGTSVRVKCASMGVCSAQGGTSSALAGMGTVTVRVDAGVELVGNIGAVRASVGRMMGGAGGVSSVGAVVVVSWVDDLVDGALDRFHVD
jgi:hypothetical protein